MALHAYAPAVPPRASQRLVRVDDGWPFDHRLKFPVNCAHNGIIPALNTAWILDVASAATGAAEQRSDAGEWKKWDFASSRILAESIGKRGTLFPSSVTVVRGIGGASRARSSRRVTTGARPVASGEWWKVADRF